MSNKGVFRASLASPCLLTIQGGTVSNRRPLCQLNLKPKVGTVFDPADFLGKCYYLPLQHPVRKYGAGQLSGDYITTCMKEIQIS